MMHISICSVHGWRHFNTILPDALWPAFRAFKDKIGFLRDALNDDRFAGHAMVWEEGWRPI